MSGDHSGRVSLVEAMRQLDLARQAFSKVELLGDRLGQLALDVQHLKQQSLDWVTSSAFSSKTVQLQFTIQHEVARQAQEFTNAWADSLKAKASNEDLHAQLQTKASCLNFCELAQQVSSLQVRLDRHENSEFPAFKTKIKQQFQDFLSSRHPADQELWERLAAVESVVSELSNAVLESEHPTKNEMYSAQVTELTDQLHTCLKAQQENQTALNHAMAKIQTRAKRNFAAIQKLETNLKRASHSIEQLNTELKATQSNLMLELTPQQVEIVRRSVDQDLKELSQKVTAFVEDSYQSKVHLTDTMKEVFETLGKMKDFKEKLKQELVKTNTYAVSVEEYAQRSLRTLKNSIHHSMGTSRSPDRHLRSESFRSVSKQRSQAPNSSMSVTDISQPAPKKTSNLAKLLANTKVALPRFKIQAGQSTARSHKDG